MRLNEPSNPEALLPHVREVVRRLTGAAVRFAWFVFEVSAILPARRNTVETILLWTVSHAPRAVTAPCSVVVVLQQTP